MQQLRRRPANVGFRRTASGPSLIGAAQPLGRMKDAAAAAKDSAVRAAGVPEVRPKAWARLLRLLRETRHESRGNLSEATCDPHAGGFRSGSLQSLAGGGMGRAGGPGEADLQQVNEWLNSRPPEIAACLREMHPPNRPLEASVLFGDTRPPEQLEGKILLCGLCDSISPIGEHVRRREKFWQSWNVGPESKPASWQAFASNSTPNWNLSRSQSSRDAAGAWPVFEHHIGIRGRRRRLCVRPNFPVQPGPGRESGGRWKSLDDVPKPIKLALLTAAVTGPVVASPFLLAALGTTSIGASLPRSAAVHLRLGATVWPVASRGSLFFVAATASTLLSANRLETHQGPRGREATHRTARPSCTGREKRKDFA